MIGFILAFLFIFQQKGIKKLFYVIAALLNLGYVTYSDSRTGEIAFVLCGGFLLYFCLIHRKSENKKYRYVKNLLIVLCIMIVSVGGMQVLKTENTRYQTEMANKTAQKTTKPQTTISTKTKKGKRRAGIPSGAELCSRRNLPGTGASNRNGICGSAARREISGGGQYPS